MKYVHWWQNNQHAVAITKMIKFDNYNSFYSGMPAARDKIGWKSLSIIMHLHLHQ